MCIRDRYPKYELSWWSEENGIYKVKIDQIQSNGIFSMPIDLNFSGSIGPLFMDTTIVVENNSASHLYEISGLYFFVENVTIDPDNWILKEATYVANGIENIVAKQISVDIAYPNPFNSNSNLNFYIHPQFGDLLVEINILDAKGRLVEGIVKKEFNPGFHSQLWNAKRNPSGIYFIQLSTDNYINTQKVLYLK